MIALYSECAGSKLVFLVSDSVCFCFKHNVLSVTSRAVVVVSFCFIDE
jgi:hypothetical protein